MHTLFQQKADRLPTTHCFFDARYVYHPPLAPEIYSRLFLTLFARTGIPVLHLSPSAATLRLQCSEHLCFEKFPRIPTARFLNAHLCMQIAPTVILSQTRQSLGRTIAPRSGRRQPCFARQVPLNTTVLPGEPFLAFSCLKEPAFRSPCPMVGQPVDPPLHGLASKVEHPPQRKQKRNA